MQSIFIKDHIHDSQPITSEDVGLYIHIPFCAQRCHFCAFYLVRENEQKIERFVADLKKEIVLWASQENVTFQKISTVYFGGGTPTVLSPDQLGDILNCVKSYWSVDAQAEVTVEATPESVSTKKITDLMQAGVSRLSMGVQTFDLQERERLGLHPGIFQVRNAVQSAYSAGLDNLSLDVMYGIPGQTVSSWEETLARVLDLRPRHLSCYALSLEEGTQFFRQWKRGNMRVFNSVEEQEFQGLANEYASKAGLLRYEISNWAFPGFACRHNLRYWQGLDYLGLGPSAQSYVDAVRWGNVADLSSYSKQLAHGQLPREDMERLSVSQRHKERVVFGLRQMEGIPVEWLQNLEHDMSLKRIMARLQADDLISQAGDRLRLTARGLQLADTVGLELW